MHIVQAYPSGSEPGWLVEGIADYVRYKYGVDNAGAGWSLPDVKANHHYNQSYRITARFLDWIETNRKPGLENVLDSAMRTGSYTDDIREAETGLTMDGLWADYVLSPHLPQDAVADDRTEERRVGSGGGSKCQHRWGAA